MSENMNCPCCGAIPGQAHDDDCTLVAYVAGSKTPYVISDQGKAVPMPEGKVGLRPALVSSWAVQRLHGIIQKSRRGDSYTPQALAGALGQVLDALRPDAAERPAGESACKQCGDTDGGWCSIQGCPNHRPDVGVKPSGGGKLTGDHYYRVKVAHPIAPDVQPYTAECADIIEALGMTFNEGEAFKAIWRLAAGRQGKTKNAPQYDADKAAHYGERIAACVRNNSTTT